MKKMVLSILNFARKNSIGLLILGFTLIGMEKVPFSQESDEQFIKRVELQLYEQQQMIKSKKSLLINNSLFSITFRKTNTRKNILTCTQGEVISSLIFKDKLTNIKKKLYEYRLFPDSFSDLKVFVSPNLSKILVKHWYDAVQIWMYDVNKIRDEKESLCYAKSYELEEQVPYHEASIMALSDQENKLAFISNDALYFTKYMVGKKVTFNMTIPQVHIPFEALALDFNKQGTKVATIGIDDKGTSHYYIHPLSKENSDPTVVYY